MVHKLLKHLSYINQRKAELGKEDKHSLINKLIIKELEIKEYAKEARTCACMQVDTGIANPDCEYCHGDGSI